MTQQSPEITGVDFVTVFVRDFERARAFYGTSLGLPCSVEYDQMPGGEFETGTVTIQLLEAAAIGLEFEPSSHPIALHVDDVAAARAILESVGAPFHGETIDSGVCHMAVFEDPDGNALMFHHRYAPRTA